MLDVLKAVRGILVLLLLTVTVFLVNSVQVMSVVLLLFSRRRFMRFNIGVKAFYCSLMGHCCYLCGNQIAVTGDRVTAENAIIMANHQSLLDIPIIWMWALPFKTIGWMKWFVKDEFKYVPGLGWGLKFANALFVKRDWSKDAGSIKETFSYILAADIPFWVMIFPEGTRMKPEKFKMSRAYARRKGSYVFDRVLLPRPKGVWATVQGLKSKLCAIYDISMAYEGEPPSIAKFFLRGGYTTRMHITRIDLTELPTIERDFNSWIQERFKLKDEWMRANSGWILNTSD